MDTIETLRSEYKRAVEVTNRKAVLTPEEQTQLETATTAFYAAGEARREAQSLTKRAKDREQRQADAEAVYTVAAEAYKAAQKPEERQEVANYIEAQTIVEGILGTVAAEVLGGPVQYINHWPTDETRDPRYGETGPQTVWATSLSDEPMPSRVTGWERPDSPFRLRWRGNGPIDLSVEVQLLDEEAERYADGLRQDTFGRRVEVTCRQSRWDKDKGVTLSSGGSGSRTIDEARMTVSLMEVAIAYAEIVEAIVFGKAD